LRFQIGDASLGGLRAVTPHDPRALVVLLTLACSALSGKPSLLLLKLAAMPRDARRNAQ
jgi:hypothetical protein